MLGARRLWDRGKGIYVLLKKRYSYFFYRSLILNDVIYIRREALEMKNKGQLIKKLD